MNETARTAGFTVRQIGEITDPFGLTTFPGVILEGVHDSVRRAGEWYEDAAKADAQAKAILAAMSPEQRESRIESLEIERDMLDYADSHVDVIGRKAAIDRKIATLRAA